MTLYQFCVQSIFCVAVQQDAASCGTNCNELQRLYNLVHVRTSMFLGRRTLQQHTVGN